MRQITKASEIIGRTIEGVYVASWKSILNFGDGDYFVIEPEHDYEDGVCLSYDRKASPYELKEAGVIDKEQIKIHDE